MKISNWFNPLILLFEIVAERRYDAWPKHVVRFLRISIEVWEPPRGSAGPAERKRWTRRTGSTSVFVHPCSPIVYRTVLRSARRASDGNLVSALWKLCKCRGYAVKRTISALKRYRISIPLRSRRGALFPFRLFLFAREFCSTVNEFITKIYGIYVNRGTAIIQIGGYEILITIRTIIITDERTEIHSTCPPPRVIASGFRLWDLLYFSPGIGAWSERGSIILFLERSVPILYTDFPGHASATIIHGWKLIRRRIPAADRKDTVCSARWQDVFCPRIRCKAHASRVCRYEQIGLTSACA